MNSKSFFKKFFLGFETIEKVNSPINGAMEVREDFWGKREIIAGRVTQSGGLVEKLWKQGLTAISKFAISNCLILGLGCGTLAQIISKKYPEAKITGIEIDPVMLSLGKKYFALDKIKNLKIIKEDAFLTINDLRLAIYDLIIVDLYLGQEFPAEAEKEDFLNNFKKLLADKGRVIFNRLYFGSHQAKTDLFLAKLKQVFPQVKVQKAVTNLLIFASF